MPSLDPSTGVIIVDHGSVRAESNETLEELVDRFRLRHKGGNIEPAHMELAEPSIATAFERCVEQGAKHIIVIPYFLGPGKHWKHDIPNLTREAADRHDGVSFQVGEPIGLHPMMLDVVDARLNDALD